MKVSERVFELWKTYGWNVEPSTETLSSYEPWCHGFEGPEPEPEIKVERATER